jgi:hypothetical protein
MGNSSTKMPLSEEGNLTIKLKFYIDTNFILVDLTHFKLLRCIGRGSFGKVNSFLLLALK